MHGIVILRIMQHKPFINHRSDWLEIYKYFNFDFEQQAGVQAVVPFAIGRWLKSRFTLTGVYDRQKDSDFWDIPFDRKAYYAMLNMNHTVTLFSHPDIKLIVSGMIRSKAIQGIYDLPASGNLDIALRYGFANGKALLTLRCNDLFRNRSDFTANLLCYAERDQPLLCFP